MRSELTHLQLVFEDRSHTEIALSSTLAFNVEGCMDSNVYMYHRNKVFNAKASSNRTKNAIMVVCCYPFPTFLLHLASVILVYIAT